MRTVSLAGTEMVSSVMRPSAVRRPMRWLPAGTRSSRTGVLRPVSRPSMKTRAQGKVWIWSVP